MKARLRRALFLLLLALCWLALAAWRGSFAQVPPPRSERIEGLEVLDGDTYRLPRGGLVRLLAVDTPERAAPWFEGDQEPWASRASEFARDKLRGAARVELLTRGQRDSHGRLLAHVLVDGDSLAALLAEAGLAAPTLNRFGDGGFPLQARAVQRRARSLAFEAPWRWRRRQRRGP
jgi:endonuclease YncB( thermonuclease family)